MRAPNQKTCVGRSQIIKIKNSEFIKIIMKFIGIFYFFIIVFYSINAFGNDLIIPKPLSNNDENLYRRVFEFQTEGKFKEAEKLIQNIENNILIGRVKAQKFLHPTGYISKFAELRDWLEKYDDHLLQHQEFIGYQKEKT